ncbi:MAG: hypothetical protein ACXVC6_00475 [Bacteroidia bacterium]
MKKASFILITAFIAVLLSSHFLVFKISQIVHQNQFRAHVSKDPGQLKKIEINPSQLYTDSKEITWEDGNREIAIGGMIYDIIAIVNTGKTVSLCVVSDNDEKKLEDNYSDIADQIFNGTGAEKPNVVKDFLSLKFFLSKPTEITIAFSDFEHVFSNQDHLVNSGFRSVEVPPPAFFA